MGHLNTTIVFNNQFKKWYALYIFVLFCQQQWLHMFVIVTRYWEDVFIYNIQSFRKNIDN